MTKAEVDAIEDWIVLAGESDRGSDPSDIVRDIAIKQGKDSDEYRLVLEIAGEGAVWFDSVRQAIAWVIGFDHGRSHPRPEAPE